MRSGRWRAGTVCFVVEDAAHAVDRATTACQSHRLPQRVRAATPWGVQLYATKNLITGEGGMVTTHQQSLEEQM
jgi:dTDP-4-amino-4,6-dideoxygalactose transaminase